MNQKTRILLGAEQLPHKLLIALFQQYIDKYKAEHMLLAVGDPHYSYVVKTDVKTDVKDLTRALKFYTKGKMASARETIANLDTAVRDVVPCVCYGQIFGTECLLNHGLKQRRKELALLRKQLDK